MRIIFLFIVIFTSPLFAQTDSSHSNKNNPEEAKTFVDSIQQPAKQKPFTIYGALHKVNDTLYFCINEVTIGDWLCYMYYSDLSNFPSIHEWENLSSEEKNYLFQLQPDSSLFPTQAFMNSLDDKHIFKKCDTCAIIKKYQLEMDFRIPVKADSILNRESKDRLYATLSLPVAGISYEQAIAFCAWRVKLDSLRFGRDCNFRLPTPDEFDLINPFQDSTITFRHTQYATFNYKNAIYPVQKGWQEVFKSCGKGPISSYVFCNHIKVKHQLVSSFFFHAKGNVAEMTSVKGVAKGGSYAHYASESFAGIKNYYEKPELWLGFRCVIEKRKN